MCHLQARTGDAFPLKVPQLELHGSCHVYYLQVWNGDPFLSKVEQPVRHWRSHGCQDVLLEKLLVLSAVDFFCLVVLLEVKQLVFLVCPGLLEGYGMTKELNGH
jgi:hypothetical protein